jgi:hypothetical protein
VINGREASAFREKIGGEKRGNGKRVEKKKHFQYSSR